MDELPDAPPPTSYLEQERRSIGGCAARFGCLTLAAVVLGVAAAVFMLIGAKVAGPNGAIWGAVAWAVTSMSGAVLLDWRRRRRPSGHAPWEHDRRWRRTGDVRSAIERELSPGAAVLIVPAVSVGALALWSYGVGVLGGIAAAVLTVGALLFITRAWLQGGVEVRWDEFPMRTGTRVRFHIATTAGGSSVPMLGAILRCLEAPRTLQDPSGKAVILAEVRCCTPGPLATGPDEFVTVEFDIPADAPGTDLSCRGDERYWELVVLGTTAWGTIAETFVVPIYAVPSASDDASAVPAGA